MSNEQQALSQEKKISVEQGYNICLTFYNSLWPSVEPRLSQLDTESFDAHQLFFLSICTGLECSDQWIEAVYRISKTPKKQQKELILTESEVFISVVNFCEICKEQFHWDLDYILNLLNEMKLIPQEHCFEWALWKQAVESSFKRKENFWNLDWNFEA